ncbi:MAG: hypothetical protein AAFQ65_02040 [Myxococcota bacterium]
MTEHFASNPSSAPSYLPPDGDPSIVAALFEALAQLYRRAPWKSVPEDQSVIGVTIEQLDVHDAVVSVIGQAGQNFGFVVFDNAGDFESYLDRLSLTIDGVGSREGLVAQPNLGRQHTFIYEFKSLGESRQPHVRLIRKDEWPEVSEGA